jgi:hypothetical protein
MRSLGTVVAATFDDLEEMIQNTSVQFELTHLSLFHILSADHSKAFARDSLERPDFPWLPSPNVT